MISSQVNSRKLLLKDSAASHEPDVSRPLSPVEMSSRTNEYQVVKDQSIDRVSKLACLLDVRHDT